MTKQGFWIVVLIAGLGQAFLCTALVADEKPKEQSEKAISKTLEKIVFIPHDVGAPDVTDAGGVRGISALPKLLVLAPENASRSHSASPKLYWYMSKGTEIPVRFTLIADDPNVIDPILDIDLGIYSEAGIYAVPLASYGISLKDDHRYSWSVALSSANGALAGGPIAQTWLEHNQSSEVDAILATRSPLDQVTHLAGKGYWYDAVDIVSQQIDAGDRSSPWHEIRAHLFDQVGLKQAAAFDRS